MGADVFTAGASGLQPHQIPDSAAKNPTSVNAAVPGAFAQLLSERIDQAPLLTDGINAAGASANLSQGNIVATGNPLDMAINGNGYFVLRSNGENIYTRTGSFAVDADYKLVDRNTGYHVQRFGSAGDIGPGGEGFQVPGDTDIKVPFGAPMTAKATSLLKVSGNLSSDTAGQQAGTFSALIFDSEGTEYILSGAFVPTNTPNTWQMILTSITPDVHDIDKRSIGGIEFDAGTGSFKGCTDTSEFVIRFNGDSSIVQTISVSMGTPGRLDGLTQFAGSSTAGVIGRNGFSAGELTSVLVDNGTLVGMFSNGQKQDIASIQVGLFQNPAGLESAGDGYYTASTDSGQAVSSEALGKGAGEVRGGALEKSVADVAVDFVNIIQAQDGFQTNARTIKVANDILGELARRIR